MGLIIHVTPTGVHRVEKGATYKDRVLGDLYNSKIQVYLMETF